MLFAVTICSNVVSCADPEAAARGGPAWEDFRDRATRVVDGEAIHVVEWDLALSLDELRAYYDRNVSGDGFGQTEQHSIVNQVEGRDDIWDGDQSLHLTYCVSDAFGAGKARVVSEMAAATQAWEAAANIAFGYLPAHDASCSNTNTSVVFSVRPWSGGGACAFFPSGGGCVRRTLVIDFTDLDTAPFYETNSPNMTTTGVLRHELGHILGFRHEQSRPESGVCFEDDNWRALTPYDSTSAMHYPWCNGVLDSDLSVTERDATGLRLLYGTTEPDPDLTARGHELRADE